MNTTDKCTNCGGDYALHHYETDQCPVGGVESPIGRKQEWKTSTFQKVDKSAETIRLLREALADARIALTFYREYMEVAENGKSRYPFGKEIEDKAREIVGKMNAELK